MKRELFTKCSRKIGEMASHHFTILFLLVLITFLLSQVCDANEPCDYQKIKHLSSPFESSLESLQKQIKYTFADKGLLRRAMTHPSFSGENNRALSVPGHHIINAFVSLYYMGKDIDISSKELNNRIAKISNVENCAVDGMRLGLDKVVRIASKTHSTDPSVVCDAFRAVFGAVAVDTGKSDDAGSVFWSVHSGDVGKALAL